jgi:hypothetical protein
MLTQLLLCLPMFHAFGFHGWYTCPRKDYDVLWSGRGGTRVEPLGDAFGICVPYCLARDSSAPCATKGPAIQHVELSKEHSR